jgi:hypothetical protein
MVSRSVSVRSGLFAVLAFGCGPEPAQGNGSTKALVPTSTSSAAGGPAVAAGTGTGTGTGSEPASPRAPRPDAAAIFERLKPDLVACYEKGRKSTPTMLDGKLTLNAAIDASGRTTCVIPTEDTGLTQEVEDCMSTRMTKESFPADDRPWESGARSTSDTLGLDSVETHRMLDAFDVLESLVPELQSCVHSIDKSSGVRALVVGARVGLDGRPQCSLAAASSGTLPPSVSSCASALFEKTRFPPPKGGPGLILVPIRINRK